MSHQSDLIATDIDAYLKQHEHKELLRFVIVGSVDDGKSTLIGRLLFELHAVYEDQPGLEQQAPDQRRLAVVDGAAGDEPQQALLAQRAQKYPSCFFFSIEAAASWSITRPSRSDVRDARISSTISATVLAELSTAPVSG